MSKQRQRVKRVADRLPAHPGQQVDFGTMFAFRFNGQSYKAYAGDTIASALWAAGVRMVGRSFKYHRPRGPFAFTPADSNSLVRVDDEPNVRATGKRVQPGMVVESQNTRPSLEFDLLSLSQLGARFMPVGFYYKTFMRPTALWPLYEKALRHAAGLGHVTRDRPDTYYDKQYQFADVAVIGGGVAGMQAALSAARQGARVLLLEEQPFLGGHLAFARQAVQASAASEAQPGYALAAHLAQQVQAEPNIQLALNTFAFGLYDQRWLGAVQNETRLLKIRAKAVVVATGAFERPLIFENNDLPGILLSSAVQRLMHGYGVRPGQRAMVVAANDEGLQTALDLQAAGVQTMVLELRPAAARNAALTAQLQQHGISMRTEQVVRQAQGGTSLKGVLLAKPYGHPLPSAGQYGVKTISGTEEFVRCDLLVTAVGWQAAGGLLYQAGAKAAYDKSRHALLPTTLPPQMFAAGRVIGRHGPAAELFDGQVAGLNAAAAVGFGEGASAAQQQQLASLQEAGPQPNSALFYVDGGKSRFISFDEDVTVKDLHDAVAEGFNGMELLKRYSTLSMGPSQGKYEHAATMALCAEATNQPLPAVGATTSRPPFSPVPLGALAGRIMEPVKRTPLHGWHLNWKAKMMNAGLWKRPEHYGNPAAEVIATRNGLGIIDVSTLGKLQLRGPDVPAVLARLYTNNWANLGPGRVRYGVMCNEEGIVFDDGVAANLGDESWYLTTTSGGANAVYENLLWNLQSGWDYRVQVINMTDSYAAMNLTGPNARAMLQPLTDVDLSNEAFPYMNVRQGQVAGVPVLLLRIGFTGELGYEMHVPAGYAQFLWETLFEAGQAYGITAFGVEAQRIMRLEKGHFIIGQDTDGLTDPFMAGLEWAVKLDKPQFLGKPSLVRIKERGVTHKLVGFQMLNPDILPEEANQIVTPNPETPIGFEIIGRVTSARYSPTLRQSIGLCWLPVERSQPGAEFSVRVHGLLQTGRVVELPFYDPAGERLKS